MRPINKTKNTIYLLPTPELSSNFSAYRRVDLICILKVFELSFSLMVPKVIHNHL